MAERLGGGVTAPIGAPPFGSSALRSSASSLPIACALMLIPLMRFSVPLS
jgi:hypothetical protein